MKRLKFLPTLTTAAFGLWCAALPNAHATISEPDNILYGNITLDGVLLTAARTDVVIEARRTTNGPAIASYRMGGDSAIGNYYSLRLAVESVTPVLNTNASQISQSVFIVVTDSSGLRAQTSYTIPDRGAVQRVDFGVAAVDSDGDGLPDAWELQRYANLNQSSGSVAPNGLTALQNFVSGTDPNDPGGGFRLLIGLTNNQKQVSFVALRAEGPGYEGRQRFYSLETSTNTTGFWATVAGSSNILGNNQTLIHQSSNAASRVFFRGRVWLQP